MVLPSPIVISRSSASQFCTGVCDRTVEVSVPSPLLRLLRSPSLGEYNAWGIDREVRFFVVVSPRALRGFNNFLHAHYVGKDGRGRQ